MAKTLVEWKYFIQAAIGLKHTHNKGLSSSLSPCVPHQSSGEDATKSVLAPVPLVSVGILRMPRGTNWAGSKPRHLSSVSLHFTPLQLLCSQLLTPHHHCATLPASQGRGAGSVCAAGKDISYRSVSSWYFVRIQNVSIFCLFVCFALLWFALLWFSPIHTHIEWNIITRSEDHAPAHLKVCSLDSRLFASLFRRKRAPEWMELSG